MKDKKLTKWAVTLSTDRLVLIESDLMKLDEGTLAFHLDGQPVALFAKGHWYSVIESV